MSTIQELRQKADELKKKEDFENALPLFREIWEREKSEWNGYYFAQCLRKTDNFVEARQLQHEIKNSFPSFRPIHNEELWLDYSEKIKDWQNPDILSDAEDLLSKTDKYDKYTGSIFNKTVLSVVKHLTFNDDNSTALEWLEKLDFSVLSTTPFSYKGQKYPSDQKVFFILYADILIKLGKHVNQIERYLTTLSFEGIKHTQFKKKIIEEITYGDYISRLVLALYLKYFKEEIHLREKDEYVSIYNSGKVTLVSDLGDFEFCPVSFAINETFSVPSNATWEKDEWLGDKKCLLDRYKDYQKSKSFDDVFKDSLIEINETTKKDFGFIFTSKILSNNHDGENKTFFSNQNNTIRGIPDYVFENSSQKKFVVVEKFTKRTSENIQSAFTNDLIKLYGYIFELSSLKIDFGFLIYWYWMYDDIETENGSIKKKMRIKAYRIFKVEKTSENKNKLADCIVRLVALKQTKQYKVEGDKISFANKCLHCSVITFCNHKTGKFNIVKLPYDIRSLTLNQEQINLPIIPTGTLTPEDDLPF